MSALIPPRHDLRGGNASDDSFAMSSNAFAVSMNRCFFAVGSHEVWTAITARSVHELGPISVPLVVGRRFRKALDMVLSRLQDMWFR